MATNSQENLDFHQMGLDTRLVKAIAKLGWNHPTPIQEKMIPLAVEGKDIVVRAKTGSGKTACYAIPMIHKILRMKSTETVPPCVRGLVLVPSKELSVQAMTNIKELCSCCSREISVVGVSHTMNIATQRTALLERPDIVVGTPSRILSHLSSQTLDIRESLEVLVVDEADLVFSYGYEDDVKNIISYLPPIYQAILMSATLNEDVLSLKKLILHQPVTLKLEESDLPEETQLTQYHIRCSEENKYLIIYTLLKLKLVRGKTLLFVNDIARCYKLKLFLEQFSIKSCVLNSELPHNSRCHVVEEFNRGIYDYVIATDEVPEVQGNDPKSHVSKKRHKRDREYGVARGIDFQGVENVINFDFPQSTDAYIHRVGRTARGFDCGTALTFVSPTEEERLVELEERLQEQQPPDPGSVSSSIVKPYKFKMSEIEGFRYRVQDALQNVSAISIKEARLKEIRSELLASNKLKTHFEENPRDLQVLRHDRVLLPYKVKEHLKHIPPYLVPKVLRTGGPTITRSSSQQNHAKKFNDNKGSHKSIKAKKNDPLKTFKVSSNRKREMQQQEEKNPTKKRKTG